MSKQSLHWDDLSVGQAFRSLTRTITEADVVAFAGLTGDYSELHTSETFARDTPYGRRVAHGMLGLAYAHGLMWARDGQFRDSAIAFIGIGEWRFAAPIMIGDTIHVEYEITELRVTRSDPSRGIATFSVRVVNQDGDVMQDGSKSLLMKVDSDNQPGGGE